MRTLDWITGSQVGKRDRTRSKWTPHKTYESILESQVIKTVTVYYFTPRYIVNEVTTSMHFWVQINVCMYDWIKWCFRQSPGLTAIICCIHKDPDSPWLTFRAGLMVWHHANLLQMVVNVTRNMLLITLQGTHFHFCLYSCSRFLRAWNFSNCVAKERLESSGLWVRQEFATIIQRRRNEWKQDQPSVFLQQGADEVFGLIRDVLEALLVELVAGSSHKTKSLSVTVALKGGFSTEPGTPNNITMNDTYTQSHLVLECHFLLLYTSSRWHFVGKYCIFYSTTFIWLLTSQISTSVLKQHVFKLV